MSPERWTASDGPSARSPSISWIPDRGKNQLRFGNDRKKESLSNKNRRADSALTDPALTLRVYAHAMRNEEPTCRLLNSATPNGPIRPLGKNRKLNKPLTT
jgi:hypothetical protein